MCYKGENPSMAVRGTLHKQWLVSWCSRSALEGEKGVVGAWVGPEVTVDTEMEQLPWAGGGWSLEGEAEECCGAVMAGAQAGSAVCDAP